jgi:zinc transport system substrate-binding protein
MEKRSYWTFLIVGLAAGLLAGCSGEETTPVEPASAKPLVPVIHVSNYPLKFMVQHLAPTAVEIVFQAGETADPAYWKPTPQDVTKMQQANLVLLNGASYEPWLKNVSLPPSRVIDTTGALKGELIELEDAVTHSHGAEGEHEHGSTAITTWMDLNVAVLQARAVQNSLTKLWPGEKEAINRRMRELETSLLSLDSHLKEAVGGVESRPVVFSHPVYQYFERRYGVDGTSVHWEPDEEPSDAMWDELRTLLRQHKAKWMIWEGQPLQSTVDRLKEMGVESVVVDPCATEPEAGDLLTVMQENLKAVRRVFG